MVRTNSIRGLLMLLGALIAANGCATKKAAANPPPTSTRDNVYATRGTLPQSVVRVAVLPIALKTDSDSLVAGRDTLSGLLPQELQRCERFEFTIVTPARLREWTGREIWAADEPLPRDFLKRISEELECEAVLFPRLTLFRPYPPLAVGWEFKLIRTSSAGVLWAADELVDAADKAEATKALAFEKQRNGRLPGADREELVLLSPTRFGQYSLHTLFSTLPGR